MQTDPSPSPLRRLTAAAAALVLLLAGCVGGGDDATPPAETETGDGVLESRAALGQPMVDLGESVIALADDLAVARYEVPRGAAMQEAVREARDTVEAAREAADAAEAATEDAPVAEAARIVADAVQRARDAVDAGGDEVAYLRSASRVDAALLEVVQQWDERGSQSEIRSRLQAAAEDAGRLRRTARRLQPAPDRCRVMKRNRVGWAATVRTRTQRLQEQANSAGGGTFDELRAAYRRLPFGVEPRTADQQERQCWRDSSAVWTAAQDVRAAVEELEAALQ